ncbi:DUF429 domain-containing protein [Rubrivivax sp. RP6-9]|uniref:DUF429 domain-containing protein n=1 Tax=Rubrivivax sp. RP6-9 TaxID=3415750 RepID=UPI003CC5769B
MDYRLFTSMRELLAFHSEASRVLVDIPIGLPWKECPARPCDVLARQKLGHRHVCVFAAPSRAAYQAASKAEARERNLAELGKSLSEQALGICAKVAEVDALLLSDTRARVREIHPEVCFWAMNNGSPMDDAKTTRAGVQARLELLSRRLPQVTDFLARVQAETPRSQVKADDVLDALAGYLTARADDTALCALRGEPSHDLEGLPMEMLYIA